MLDGMEPFPDGVQIPQYRLVFASRCSFEMKPYSGDSSEGVDPPQIRTQDFLCSVPLQSIKMRPTLESEAASIEFHQSERPGAARHDQSVSGNPMGLHLL
jgi:hypothetical protein